MAPTEESILRSFLLQKASLRDTVTLAEFTSYFPASKRSNPLIRQLFRDIQTHRNSVCESVLKQINLECRMGDNLIAKKRAERETRIESTGDNEHSGLFEGTQDETVPLETVVPEMKLAAQKLRDYMDQVQRELNESFMRLKRVSEDLSDLKYGTTDQHVSNELKTLVEAGDRLLAQSL